MNYEKINELIAARGMNKGEFYRRIGMTRSGFVLMRKNNSIKISILEKIAQTLSVPISYFFRQDDRISSPVADDSELYWKGRYDELIKARNSKDGGLAKRKPSSRSLREALLASGRAMTSEEITSALESFEPNSVVFYLTKSGNAYFRTLYGLDNKGNPVFFNWKALGAALQKKKLNPTLLIDKSLYTFRVKLSDIVFLLPDSSLKLILKDHCLSAYTGMDLRLEAAL